MIFDMRTRRMEKLFLYVEGDRLRSWTAEIDRAESYDAHALLHRITSAAGFEDCVDESKENGNSIYLLLKPFLNRCDSALGRIASKLCSYPSFTFHEAQFLEDCKVLARMMSRSVVMSYDGDIFK